MSNFEKLAIAVAFNKQFKRSDFTKESGFIDSFSNDDDKPSINGCILLAYDARLHNDKTIELSRRFDESKFLKSTYIKTIDNVPYYVYAFWIPKTFKHFYKGHITLTPEQKVQVLQFWGASDELVHYVLSDSVLWVNTEHKMPLENCYKPIYRGLKIKGTKIGDSLE